MNEKKLNCMLLVDDNEATKSLKKILIKSFPK